MKKLIVLLIALLFLFSGCVDYREKYEKLNAEYEDLEVEYEILTYKYNSLQYDYDELNGKYEDLVLETGRD